MIIILIKLKYDDIIIIQCIIKITNFTNIMHKHLKLLTIIIIIIEI